MFLAAQETIVNLRNQPNVHQQMTISRNVKYIHNQILPGHKNIEACFLQNKDAIGHH